MNNFFNLEDQIYIEGMVYIFYSLEFVSSMADLADKQKTGCEFLKSHIQFKKDIMGLKNKFDKKLAEILYDYMLCSIAREMEESRSMCKKTIAPFLNSHRELNPIEVLERIHMISPDNLLDYAIKIFASDLWEGNYSYGGKAWKKCAIATSRYKKIPNNIFIDSIVDLEHNNGSILDKGFFFTIGSCFLEEFIEYKVDMDLNLLFSDGYLWPFDIRKIMMRFIHIYNMYLPKNNKLTDVWKIEQGLIDSLEIRKETERDYKIFWTYEPIEYQSDPRFIIKPEHIVDTEEYQKFLESNNYLV